MIEKVSIGVIDEKGVLVTWWLSCSREGDECLIATRDANGTAWTGAGPDWFDALRDLRVSLDQFGIRPLCVGAQVNVGQSAMLAEASLGEYVYILKPGRTPRKRAWIFDPARPENVVSVAEQEAAYERWLSLPKKTSLVGQVIDRFRDEWRRIRYL